MSLVESEESHLLDLPPDVLLLIFPFCDTQTLGRLSCTCRKLNNLICHNCVWIPRTKDAIAANQVSCSFLYRSCCHLSPREKCRISRNWSKGWCQECLILQDKIAYMPWLQLERNFLWYSKGNSIYRFHRYQDGRLSSSPKLILKGHTEDVSRFVYRNELVFSGGRDGSICCWYTNTGHLKFSLRHCHSSDINSVDLRKNVAVSGSRDKSVKVWTLAQSIRCQYTINFCDRVWDVAIMTSGRSFLSGSAGYNDVPPLQMFDLETGNLIGTFGNGFRKGAGVLHICPESEFQFLSCGYDTSVRLWDTRCNAKCVAQWEDPYDSVVYCVSSDQHVTFLSGTSRHGLVRLWDKRAAKCLQIFYVGRENSPVYSTVFDPCNMYVALDKSLYCLSFYGYYSRHSHVAQKIRSMRI